MKKKIGVLTSGGDCPGLNAVLRGIVRASDHLNWEVIGFVDGYEGILPPVRTMPLTRQNTAGIMQLGGTILGTTNKGNFISKVGDGRKMAASPQVVEQARQAVHDLELDALVAIGGDGSLTTALQLFEEGFPMIGVPKTIDNDLQATAMTFGFDSAVACVADALDRLHTTASSHKRVMVLEVMGRHAGWIALYGGLAGGADMILLPEIRFDYEKIADVIKRREAEGYKSTMIVVAEGACPLDGSQVVLEERPGEYRLGGIGERVAREISQRTAKETRTCVLGHLQRGGPPTTLDRILGTRFGVHAVRMIEENRFGRMVSYQNYVVTDVSIAEAVHSLRTVPLDHQMIETSRAVGISFGD